MAGIRHVTAIAGDGLSNVDSYTHQLGLRFIKKAVNFDEPTTYHFYYGNETGSPGTVLTFNAKSGQPGVGEARQLAFRVPLRSINYWTQRFVGREFITTRWRSTSVSPFCP